MSEPLPKWTAQKVAILVIVVVFFISSFALSALVIYESFFQTDDVNSAQLDQLNTQEGDMLEGTQLAEFSPIETVEQLQVIDQTEGTGAEVKPGDTITAHYTGAVVATGTIFQSSKDMGQPFTSPLSGLIAGWQEGIPGMKEGGKRRLLIPAEQAYGANPPQGIPPNAALVFDIELLSIES